jgi:predicted nucleic acid-binding protein
LTERSSRRLVLDTSVAVKWYLTEELDDHAGRLLEAAGSGVVEFSAPSTIQPELFNALWQRRRRGELTLEEVHQVWGGFVSADPATLYAPEDLMPHATEIVFGSGVIIYDALFLALAELVGAVMVTADIRLLNLLEGTPHAHLAHSLVDAASLIPSSG